MPYTYDHPHPAVATDVALFTLRDAALNLLLIRRGLEPFAGRWALPGGFVGPDEDLDACARRELLEETGVAAGPSDVHHFDNFSAPGRDPRPNERVISVAYFALLPSDQLAPRADTDAQDARWWPTSAMPDLAFDHNNITAAALAALRERAKAFEILLRLMPASFTLTQLQTAYDAVMGVASDKRNFTKAALASGTIHETGELVRGAHRPARLYRRA
jgi:8-oxo-dGTP diphosphatase